jgi:hypothetical protein
MARTDDIMNPANYTYTRNEFGWLLRDGKGRVPEDDPDNVAYQLYQQWLELGNLPPPMPEIANPIPQWGQPKASTGLFNPETYTYSRNKYGYIVRDQDQVLILEEDKPNNIAYQLYKQWLELGNNPPPELRIAYDPYKAAMEDIDPADFTYSRNNLGYLVRSDGIVVLEDDPENISYMLYQEWIGLGNEPIPGAPPPNWPHTPVEVSPEQPLPPDPGDGSLSIKKYIDDQIAHALAHSLGHPHSHPHEEPKK